MAGTCDKLTEVASAGVAPALRAVDCVANEMAGSAFGRLFGAGGAMAPVLTAVLTLYIVFFAYSLLTGRTTLGISALTPRMLRLGVVLVLVTSLTAYQTFVWNLALGGPDWIAAQLMGVKGSATTIFGDRIDIVFGAISDIASNSSAQGAGNGEAAKAATSAAGLLTPDTIMWMGALLLLLGTVGVLLTARIALAVLLAIGPVFIIFGLFDGTRGLTAGWLRGVALTAVTPLFVVLGGGVTLELLVPIISGMVQSAALGEVDARAAMAFFLVAAVHVALMIMVVKVASTMAAGWRVFGLAGDGRAQGAGSGYAAAGTAVPAFTPAPAPAAVQGRASGIASAGATAMADVSQPSAGTETRSSDRRTVVTQVTGGGIEPMYASSNTSRTRGIGSRFRGASNDAGRTLAKEKMQ
ncbi:type IV secretion system protein [Novosphingobium beihaiensis]|uniref:Type IV secretion system protein n=1 Tax=Novosphingobium beihaiensis TaxID=2930389 RepID=A0ABT0BKM6_9SPHN|nr:type IV secretion system protein [Novosphingobium beihaiensis]MCJ2185569.1 type IV secretion system protein [Novosphingobium beihaiensis]